MYHLDKFIKHPSFTKFAQNADYGSSVKDASIHRERQIRALHWLIHELEQNGENNFSEVEIKMLELSIYAGQLDNHIYSN